MSELDLCTYGPRSAHYTRQVAEGLSECVRVLNHHTTDADALPDPTVIYDVLGSLHTAATSLDQLLRQLADRLAVMSDTGQLASDHGDPQTDAGRARQALGQARSAAGTFARRAETAHQATSGLYLRQGDGR